MPDSPNSTATSNIDVNGEMFSLFKESVRRCRWFLLATSLIGGLIFLHVYLETLSFRTSQIRTELVGQISEVHRIDRLQTWLGSHRKGHPEYRQKADEYADLRLKQQKHVNDLSKQGGSAILPFISYPVPNADYLPVMALFLAGFSVGLWLNYRVARSAVQQLDDADPSLIKLARLHFSFTGPLEAVSGRLARASQYLAVVVPTAVLVCVLLWDVVMKFDPLDSRNGGLDPQNFVYWHVALLAVATLLTCAATVATIRQIVLTQKVLRG